MHSRSQFQGRTLKTVILLFSFAFCCSGPLSAQDELNVIRGESSNNSWIQFTDAPNALYHHLAGQAFEMLDKRASAVSELETVSDWKRRRQSVRERLEQVVGPFPPKTPLNARVVRTIQKNDYKVEHVIFESQPEFYVTSSLFLPRNRPEEAPAVIYLSGHTPDGYRDETYQHKIINLVKKGFIVFAIDPLGQGERMQYLDPETGESVVGSATREHSYAGAQAFLTGNSLARYMIWDGIRAVDYLLTRDEVDSNRIGVTGRSGGGTQSAYLAAFDERIHAAAPEAYITSFKRLLQSIGPQDAEQNFYHGIASGLDHADLLEVRAPKPALVITTTEDFFSIQGARETAREVSKAYKAYGKPENFNMVEDGGGHGSTRNNREAMYAFFQEHLDNPGDPSDQEVTVLNEEEIRVTRTGQVATSFGGENVFSLNRKQAREKISKLRESRQNLGVHLPAVLASAKDLAGYQPPAAVDNPVFTGRIPRDGYVIEKYFVKGEGAYPVPYLLLKPDHPNGRGILYLHPDGKAAEASVGGEMEWLAEKGFTVLAPDLVGTGETGPGALANYMTQVKNFGATSFDDWTAAVLVGRSIAGVQAADAVRLTGLLAQQSGIQAVYGVARQEVAPVLLHAAAFESVIERVALIEPYASYEGITQTEFYNPVFHSSTVAGSLPAYDLPDLAATLAPRKLLMAGMTDAAGGSLSKQHLDEGMAVVRAAYDKQKALGRLTITGHPETDLQGLLEDWIK
ncbi:Cephalosporin-C deacetylase [Fodinibius sediminis]|uniref:Cephalosporin-C deacetylase n=2 Tax=Fodinibius sediminis TaxID=1214077 RepID=A0A521E589_9BACT|nr:Cephalosporin-C deacetylase [Fodinibius sediminis]